MAFNVSKLESAVKLLFESCEMSFNKTLSRNNHKNPFHYWSAQKKTSFAIELTTLISDYLVGWDPTYLIIGRWQIRSFVLLSHCGLLLLKLYNKTETEILIR